MSEERVTRDLEVLRWRDGATSRESDRVAEEARFTIHVEPLGTIDIVMSPESVQEFIVGHLYCEGLIGGAEQVADITVAEREDRLEVLVELDPRLVEEATRDGTIDLVHRRGLIQTECGAPSIWRVGDPQPIDGSLGMGAETIAGIPAAVRDRSHLFVETGAFHYAFLMDTEGAPVVEAFDVGRHTAVDKVVGRSLVDGMDLTRMALYTTGRISSDVARKCVRARVPLVISRGAPLAGAIALAREYNLGMVGFLRGGRFNVYAGEGHVAFV